MIFNSISNQINQKKRINNHHYDKTYYRSSINHQYPNPNISDSRLSSQSTLSQLNQKISQNIDYIKYKDQIRRSQLKNSRISNTSKDSRKSNHSNSSYKLRHQQRSSDRIKNQTNNVFVPRNQHYFPQPVSIKNEIKTWSNQKQIIYQPQADTNVHRQIIRKPITIEQYNSKYLINTQKQHTFKPQERTYQRYQGFNNTENSNIFSDVRSQKNSSRSNPVVYQQKTLSRQWSNTFAQKKNQKIPTNQKQQKQFLPPQIELKSPLTTKKQNKNGIILAAVIIALGFIILLLQITK